MAKKQITAASSAADRAQAQRELAQAQLDLQAWKQSIPPVFDPELGFEVTGYTLGDLNNQARIIANGYDYVDYGAPSTPTVDGATEINLGGNRFFVQGFDGNTPVLPPSVTGQLSDDSLPIENQTTNELAVADFLNSDVETSDGISSRPLADFSSGSQNLANSTDQRAADPLLSDGAVATNNTAANSITDNSNPQSNFDTNSDSLAERYSNTLEAETTSNETPVSTVPGTAPNTDDAGGPGSTGNQSGLPLTSAESDSPNTLTPNSERSNTVAGRSRAEQSGVVGNTPGTGVVNNPNVVISGTGTGGNAISSTGSGEVNGSLYEENPSGVAVKQNVLHNYANWTYNISMYMLSIDATSELLNSGQPNTAGYELMFSSGGTGGQGTLNDNLDYYIQRLNFTTIGGMNAKTTKHSNNFDLNLTVVEPYGVNLLTEIKAKSEELGVRNFTDTAYLVEIKFKGYTDDGTPVGEIPNTTRYIPVRIMNITFKINGAGTVYEITTVPFGYSSLVDPLLSRFPDNVKLEGHTFEQLIDNLSTHLQENDFKMAETDGREGLADQFWFDIKDADLKSSTVGFLHVTDGEVRSLPHQSYKDKLAEYITISAGTLVKTAIANVAQACNFEASFNTVGFPESKASDGEPIRLIKVITNVVPTDAYIETANRYQKIYIFKIETQKMYGLNRAGHPTSDPASRGYVKQYDWIFTGENKDITNLELEYNMQYFALTSIGLQNQQGAVKGTSSIPAPPPTAPSSNVDASQQAKLQGRAYQDAQVSTANTLRGAGHTAAANLMDNMLNNPGGDMVQLDLEIIGDPDWISQDRSILPAGMEGSYESITGPSGSINIDLHDPLIMLRFKTPRDYNENGLMNIKEEQNFIRGMYRVITIDSVFEGGTFKQTLTTVRAENQLNNK